MNEFLDGIQVILDEAPHSAYMQAVEREEGKLEYRLGDIQARCDASKITRLEAASERVQALEAHLAACQGHRRYYLSGM
jgi:hypothetical protein